MCCFTGVSDFLFFVHRFQGRFSNKDLVCSTSLHLPGENPTLPTQLLASEAQYVISTWPLVGPLHCAGNIVICPSVSLVVSPRDKIMPGKISGNISCPSPGKWWSWLKEVFIILGTVEHKRYTGLWWKVHFTDKENWGPEKGDGGVMGRWCRVVRKPTQVQTRVPSCTRSVTLSKSWAVSKSWLPFL